MLVKESITEALLQLMDKKPYDDISISELAERAGVSRVSFYRNYKSKDEILLIYLIDTANAAWDNCTRNSKKEKWLAVFKVFESIKPMVKKAERAGRKWLFYELFKSVTNNDNTVKTNDNYQRALLIGIFFGLFDWWTENEMKESAEELTELFGHVAVSNILSAQEQV